MNIFIAFTFCAFTLVNSILADCKLSSKIDPAQINYPENVCLRLIAAYKNLRQKAAIIFHGPTGTGKSLLASNIANQNEAYLVVIESSSLVGKYAGEAEKKITEKINHAIEVAKAIHAYKNRPKEKNSSKQDSLSDIELIAQKHKSVVVVVEEVDSLAQTITTSIVENNSQKADATISLWRKIDEITKDPILDSHITVIMTTNRVNDIDNRIVDRSTTIEIPQPTPETIKSTLLFYLETYNLKSKFSDDLINDISKLLVGCSLRSLEQAISEIDLRIKCGFSCTEDDIVRIFNLIIDKNHPDPDDLKTKEQILLAARIAYVTKNINEYPSSYNNYKDFEQLYNWSRKNNIYHHLKTTSQKDVQKKSWWKPW